MTSASNPRTGKPRGRPPLGRDRIINAAYDLFLRHGVRATGIDAIIVAADIARMTFYRNFVSKDELVRIVLQEHERRWTEEWLKKETLRRFASPKDRLLGMFDLFHEWFQQRRFDGCLFIRTLIESPPASTTHRAAARHLANVRGFIEELAKEAGIKGAADFAGAWQVLLEGAIVAALGGSRAAARLAKPAAAALLASTSRRAARAS